VLLELDIDLDENPPTAGSPWSAPAVKGATNDLTEPELSVPVLGARLGLVDDRPVDHLCG
jgi:hypothetical protein